LYKLFARSQEGGSCRSRSGLCGNNSIVQFDSTRVSCHRILTTDVGYASSRLGYHTWLRHNNSVVTRTHSWNSIQPFSIFLCSFYAHKSNTTYDRSRSPTSFAPVAIRPTQIASIYIYIYIYIFVLFHRCTEFHDIG
jgi:hypothetical protein